MFKKLYFFALILLSLKFIRFFNRTLPHAELWKTQKTSEHLAASLTLRGWIGAPPNSIELVSVATLIFRAM